jgi:hypothetical protein
LANGAVSGALVKIRTPGREQLTVGGGTCVDCQTGSLVVSAALFRMLADLVSGQFTTA